jgi:hypothetical protein
VVTFDVDSLCSYLDVAPVGMPLAKELTREVVESVYRAMGDDLEEFRRLNPRRGIRASRRSR